MKILRDSLISLLIYTSSLTCFGQYHDHGIIPYLFITSDFYGYWAENYDQGSHGHGYRLYRIDNWTSTLLREKSGEFGGYYLSQPFFLNDSVGFIPESYQGSLEVFRTLNYGEDWNSAGGGSSINSNIFYLDSVTGYVSHFPGYENSSYVHGYGLGQSWQTNEYDFDGKVLYFLNDSMGYLTAYDLENKLCVLATMDFGENWSPSFCEQDIVVYDIRFFDQQFGFCVGNNGMILKTMDGGNNWEVKEAGTDDDLHCIRYFNEEEWIIAGDAGTLLRSNDKGESWEPEINNLESNLRYITLTDTRIFIQDANWRLFSDKEVGTTPREKQMITIYPNPSDQMINIEGLDEMKVRAKVTDLFGQTILELDIQKQLNLKDLPQGIYLLNLDPGNGKSITRKIVKY